MNVVVIGGVAVGPKVASRFKRLKPEAQVTMIDEGSYISFGGCGIPYYVSGEINALDALRSTTYGAVRDPGYFEGKGIVTRIETRVVSIDRAGHTVLVENVHTGAQETVAYDKLVLGTGSIAKIPPVPGRDLKGVTAATTLEAAREVRAACASGKISRAVVVGGGFIGLEMAVALADMWGIHTTVVECMEQIMQGVLSPVLADMVQHDLENAGVTVLVSEKVQRLESGSKASVSKGNVSKSSVSKSDVTKSDVTKDSSSKNASPMGSGASPSAPSQGEAVARVVTDKRTIEADLVIFATGFAPNTRLAKEAGLDVDAATGGIVVNSHMETSDPAIYAGGDCVAVPNVITGKLGCFQLGSLANRQGRVIGTNLAGGTARFDGAVGTWALKSFGISACGVGLTLARAKATGLEAMAVNMEQLDRAHFYPEKNMMTLELVVETATRRILGLQGLCVDGDALKARIDAVATMLQFGKPTIDDLANAEVAYAPPFASALDVVNSVANVADNALSGMLHGVNPRQFTKLWNERANNDVYFADARPRKASENLAQTYPDEWHQLPLEEVNELAESVPTDRPVALICNTGLRAYEVMLNLRKRGISRVTNAMGGMQAMNKRGQKFE